MPRSFLEKIKSEVFASVERLKQEMPLAEWHDRALRRTIRADFRAALSKNEGLNVIAEIKKASPSRGVIRGNFDPVALARIYEGHDAAAISVLTEEKYFLGSVRVMAQVAMVTSLPVLRKDFILDEVQIAQARSNGAAAVLLIVAFLNQKLLEGLCAACSKYSIAAFVEVHNEEELKRAAHAGAMLIGVNNRNLKNLEVDLSTSERLIAHKKAGQIFVAESGLSNHEQLLKFRAMGYDAFLIGEHLMKSSDPGAELDRLREGK